MAQCTPFAANYPDTLCSNSPLDPISFDSSYTNYKWLLGLPDIEFDAASVNHGNIGSSLTAQSFGIKIIENGGQWFGFVKRSNARTLHRYDFGNSLSNTPTVTPLVVNSFLNETSISNGDIDLVEINGSWYGYTPVRTGNGVIRYEFGNSLSNDTVTATNLGNIGGLLNWPRGMDVEVVNDSILFAIGNYTGSSFVIMNMGIDPLNAAPIWTNTISTSSSPAVGLMTSIELVVNCHNYFCFAVGRSNDNLVRYDFGTNPQSAPAIDQIGSNGNFLEPYSMQYEDRLGYPRLFVKSRSSSQNILEVGFQDSLRQSTSSIEYTNHNTFAAQYVGNGLDIEIDSTGIRAFIVTASSQLRVITEEFKEGLSASLVDGIDLNQIIIDSSGEYVISLKATDNNGLSANFIDTVTFLLGPEASLSIENFCLGDTTRFQASYDSNGNAIQSLMWDFGNTITSNTKNSELVYLDTGIYNISVEVQTINGCSDIADTAIYINPLPIPHFTADSFCQGEMVILFDSSSFFNQDSINVYDWSHNQATVSTADSLIFQSLDSGLQTITLTVQTLAGCTSLFSDDLYFREAPIAQFDLDSTCLGDNTLFNSSAEYSGTFTSFWNLGNGNTANQQQFSYEYPTAGLYNVSLVTSADNGCVDSVSKPVRIGATPSIDINFTSPFCQRQPIELIRSIVSNDSIRFENIISTADTLPLLGDSFSLNALGTTPISYHLTVGTFCHAKFDTVISINGQPDVTLDFSALCNNQLNEATYSASYPDAQTTSSVSWTLHGNTSMEDTLTYNAMGGDTAQVAFSLVSDSGCISEIDTTLELIDQPELETSLLQPICSSSPLNISMDTTFDVIDSYARINYHWYINGDTQSSVTVSNVILSDSGSFSLIISLESNAGCTTNDTLNANALLGPSDRPNIGAVCLNDIIAFTSEYDGSNYDHFWTIDSAQSFQSKSFQFQFQLPGPHQYTLTTEDKGSGCSSFFDTTLYVANAPDLSINSDIYCVGFPTELTSSISIDSLDSIDHYNWNVNRVIASNQPSAFVNENAEGTQIVELNISTKLGCNATFEKLITPYEATNTNIDITDTFGITPFQISAVIDTSGDAYFWSLNQDSIGNQPNLNHIISAEGIYSLDVKYVDSNLCYLSANKRIIVSDQQPDIAILNVNLVDSGSFENVVFEVQNQGEIPIQTSEFQISTGTGPLNFVRYDQQILPLSKATINGPTISKLSEGAWLCVEALNVNGTPDLITANNRLCQSEAELPHVRFFPNPFNDIISMELLVAEDDTEFTLMIFDQLGQPVTSYSFTANKGFFQQELNLALLSSGMYYLQLEAGNINRTAKLIKP